MASAVVTTGDVEATIFSSCNNEITEAEPIKEEESPVTLSKSMGVQENFAAYWTSVFQAEKAAEIVATAEDYKVLGGLSPVVAGVDNYFRISDRKSTFYIEFYGGMTTFFSMCYIMVLNGVIIAQTGITKNGSLFATALSSGLFTFMMGALVNVPMALAPGMGLNGFFATVATTCKENKSGSIDGVRCAGWGDTSLPWSDAMGAVFLSGIFYLFLTFTGLRQMLFHAVPPSLRTSITIGIGFFITMIGLKIGEITKIELSGWGLAAQSNAHCKLGVCDYKNVDLNFAMYENGIANFKNNASANLSVLGVIFATGLTLVRVPGAIILSIILCTFIGINMGMGTDAAGHNTMCNSQTPGAGCVTDLSGWRGKMEGSDFAINTSMDAGKEIPSGLLTFRYAMTLKFWDCVWTFLFVELFDSFGTLTGLMTRCGFLKTKAEGGDPELAMTRVNRGMLVDGFGLCLGAIIGSNSITCYIESNTGVEAGARTGFASIVTGSAFLLSLAFIAPFVGIIPNAATCCALVMVGVHSFDQAVNINYKDFIDLTTAFLTIAIMGFTYSIANGICAGFIWFAYMRTLRYIQLRACQHFKLPEDSKWMPDKGLETDLPHPLLIALAVFMAIRFAYLSF
jgi:AGZA family xanthine/uracil permease-like MFS transporter